jgi:plasmid replication initiation protein
MNIGRGAVGQLNPVSDSSTASGRRPPGRFVLLDRSIETFPVFRLSDSSEESAIVFAPDAGGRWRILPSPGDRLPGTFDQDVYVELFRRYHEAGTPADGVVTFTLHSFLRSMGRRADGRTYEQLRSALNRLERTTVESTGAYWSAATGAVLDLRFSLLSGVAIDRRRMSDRDQIPLFPAFTAFEPGDARVTLSPHLRGNIAAGHVTMLSAGQYFALSSPVARRLYRLLEVARAEGALGWRLPLAQLAECIPLTQRYPSHLQRVLQPANEMLLSAGVVRVAELRQVQREWVADYVLASRGK